MSGHKSISLSSVPNLKSHPMCNEPVTFGGGIETTKGSLPRSKLGLKNP